MSEATKTLILKSAGNSVARPIVNPESNENLNERPWRKVGENAYEGDIYEVYQPIFDTNAFVWIQKGKIAWEPLEVQTLPTQTLPLALRGQPLGFTAPLDVLSDLDAETRRLTAELASGAPLPGWLEFDPAGGTLVGAPPEGSLGDWSIRLLGRDDDQVQAQTFNLSVKNPVDIPTDGAAVLGAETPDYLSAVGKSGYYRLEGLGGADILMGSEQRDLLLGGDGNDQLFGNGGTDQLVGGQGDDLLDGGAGLDFIYGGVGADNFVLRAGDGGDRLMDFNAGEGDLFLLDNLTFDALSFDGNKISLGAELLATVSDHIGNPVTNLADNPQWFVSI